MSIEYIATANGYMSGRYIGSGEVFTSDQELSGSWFKCVDQPETELEPETEKPKKARKARKAEGEKVEGVIE